MASQHSQERWECGWIIGVTWKDCHQATSNNHATTSVVVSDYQVKINHWHDRPLLDSHVIPQLRWCPAGECSKKSWQCSLCLTTTDPTDAEEINACLSVQHYKASQQKEYSLKSTSSSLSFLGADDQSWSHYSTAGSAQEPAQLAGPVMMPLTQHTTLESTRSNY